MNKETMLLLKEQFDAAFAAPDGIQKLRELILTLAMQGKLVPQDPRDQPASGLLKEIEAEKKRLVKEGKIKQPKPIPEIKSEEVPFDLPKNWEWVRLAEIVSLLGDGLHGTPTYDETGKYFFINGNNLSDGRIEIKENTQKVSTHEYLKYKKELNSSTVLVSINGTIGNVAFYNNENVILGKSACYFNLFKKIDKEFTKKLLNSPYFLEYALSSATGTTIKNVSLKAMREFLFPLPPLAEQRRIVTKIDQLMARCDELEKLRNERAQKLITLHTAALDRLLTAKDSQSFSTAWRFITQHFGELYSVKETVAELRKAILQLAVMGKLVPQDPQDEPASELLKEIEIENKCLIQEGKLKALKPPQEILEEEQQFNIPSSWEWVRLETISNRLRGITYGIVKMGEDPPSDGVPALRCSDVKYREMDLSSVRKVTREISKQYSRTELKGGELLLNIRGTLGGCAIAPGNIAGYNIAREIAMIPLMKSVYNVTTQAEVRNVEEVSYRKRGTQVNQGD